MTDILTDNHHDSEEEAEERDPLRRTRAYCDWL